MTSPESGRGLNSWASVPGIKMTANAAPDGRRILQEYDGLETGELAWILGKRAKGTMSDTTGIGKGPDRMQRLAYTAWIEAFFRASFGKEVIDLNTLALTGPEKLNVSEGTRLMRYRSEILSSSALSMPDIARPSNASKSKALGYNDGIGGLVVAANLKAGLFVMERGPFLRGKILEDMPVQMTAGGGEGFIEPRNLGDELAFEMLYAKLGSLRMFDWMPDGMVLSKLESPSGDVYSSSELDARQGQLFNLAVQGPAIAKTWCGQPKLQTMPMDRVFVVVVADVCTSADETEVDEYVTAVEEQFREFVNKDKSTAYSDAVAKADAFLTGNIGDWEAKAFELRKEGFDPKYSKMTNFRLERMTSSYMVQDSHFKQGDKSSRCGLRIGKLNTAYCAEYIIGGWCIGTVLDNSASRSVVGTAARVAPASMAINVNVNIEWWSSDKMYRHYMDVDGKVFRRDQQAVSETDKRARLGGYDVNPADRVELEAAPMALPA